jgi:transcriptional regulator with XRE-family HTH domain
MTAMGAGLDDQGLRTIQLGGYHLAGYMDLIEQTVAENIRRLREERNVSLSELSRRSGVAKATLSSLEAGAGNPTIQTLTALAAALNCSLGDLIEQHAPQLLRDGEGLWVEGEATRGRLIARLFGQRGVDVHEVVLKKGRKLEARPLIGTTEHLYLLEGEVNTGLEGEGPVLKPGDTIRFPSDRPYAIRAVRADAKGLFFINTGDVGPTAIAAAQGNGPRPRRRRAAKAE